MPLSFTALPALESNYIWVLHDARHAVVIDPGVAEPVLTWLKEQRKELAAVLITHHHHDHIGGLDELLAAHPAPVYGPADERIPQISHPAADGELLKLAAPALSLQVLAVPGHTLSHLAFFGHGLLLCGDTLFSAGCGRLFEGSSRQMLDSLDRLAALPGETQLLCAHEYTMDNCLFALAVEPENAALVARLDQARALRAQGQPTLPSTLAAELEFNPFLRCDQPAVVAAASKQAGRQMTSRLEVFTALRAWKDHFRPPAQET